MHILAERKDEELGNTVCELVFPFAHRCLLMTITIERSLTTGLLSPSPGKRGLFLSSMYLYNLPSLPLTWGKMGQCPHADLLCGCCKLTPCPFRSLKEVYTVLQKARQWSLTPTHLMCSVVICRNAYTLFLKTVLIKLMGWHNVHVVYLKYAYSWRLWYWGLRASFPVKFFQSISI